MKQVAFFFFLILSRGEIFSQEQKKCATVLYNQNLELKNKSFRLGRILLEEEIRQRNNLRIGKINSSEPEYIIPVVVHIIRNVSAPFVSDEQVFSQIRILNEDYSRQNPDTGQALEIFKSVAADTKIKFCLATRDPSGQITNGIVRKSNTQASFDPSNDNTRLKSLSYWPSDQYLNIWVTNLSSNFIGYAQFPNISSMPGLGGQDSTAITDGVVIDPKAFGDIGTAKYPYNKGRTATHEIGHWLGLLHTWGDDENKNSCGTDYVDDTPPQDQSTTGCTRDTTVCNSLPPHLNMMEDFMDYTSDRCMNLFTHGQKDRMRAVIELSPRRKSLLRSAGCCQAPSTFSLPVTEDFEENNLREKGWLIYNPSGDTSWFRSGPGGFNKSLFSLKINNQITLKNYDAFISPFIHFKDVEHAYMEFDLAYSRANKVANTDSLVISYSPNCKDSILIKTFYGDELITTSKTADNFIPSAEDWKKIKIDLKPLAQRSLVQIRFENFSRGINNLYIDNINIYSTSDKLSVNVFPNPSWQGFFINVSFTDKKNVYLDLYNALGQKVWEDVELRVVSFKKEVYLPALAEGTYILRVRTDNEHLSHLILLLNKL